MMRTDWLVEHICLSSPSLEDEEVVVSSGTVFQAVENTVPNGVAYTQYHYTGFFKSTLSHCEV